MDDITTMISKIQKKIMALFSEWSKKQRNNMQINQYMGMILGGETNERKKFLSFKNFLYKTVKISTH